MDRIDRISEEIKKELSELIRTGIKDPRLPDFVSVTALKVTKDLRHATAFISVFADENGKKEAMAALKHAAGFIRREIGQRVNLRYTPEFTFKLDDSIEHGIHINKLIREAVASDKASPGEGDKEADKGSSGSSGRETDTE